MEINLLKLHFTFARSQGIVIVALVIIVHALYRPDVAQQEPILVVTRNIASPAYHSAGGRQ